MVCIVEATLAELLRVERHAHLVSVRVGVRIRVRIGLRVGAGAGVRVRVRVRVERHTRLDAVCFEVTTVEGGCGGRHAQHPPALAALAALAAGGGDKGRGHGVWADAALVVRAARKA